jgi:hypothetical protein
MKESAQSVAPQLAQREEKRIERELEVAQQQENDVAFKI